MRWASKLWLRLRSLFRRGPVEQELDDELRFHLEQQIEENLAAGMSPEEARYAARRAIGGIEQIKEECRDTRRVNAIVSVSQDLRYAARLLRRSPVFTVTALASLALGIGANSAIFTAMDAILWKPLPIRDPRGLVRFSVTRENRHPTGWVPEDFGNELVRGSAAFSEMIAATDDGLTFSLEGRGERVVGAAVSPNFFTALGIQPILGQGFSFDVQKGRWAPEVVLSYDFWRSRFAGDVTVIGRTVHLNKYPFVVTGIAPAGFFGLETGIEPELWLPIMPPGRELSQIALISHSQRRGFNVARLRPGMTLTQAEAAADAQFQRYLRELPPDQGSDLGHIHLLPGETGDHGFVAQFERPLFVLLGLTALVLLIACSNVANMLLARASARHREFAVRASIGAGRARLVRQMLVENLLLWLAGGLLGLAVASWTNDLLFRLLPQGHMRMVLDLRPDPRAVLFTLSISLATGILFGMAPALTATRGDPAGALKTDSAGSIGGGQGFGFRKGLVVSQVALSMLLLIVSGLFVRTLANLHAIDYGYRPDRVLLFTMKPQVELYPPQQIQRMTADLVRRVSLVPGVRSAAIAEEGPLGSRGPGSTMIRVPGGQPLKALTDEFSPGFFETLGMTQLAGRDFSPSDQQGSPLVVILNDVLARALFRNENPVGRVVVADSREPRQFQIAGVVRASRYNDLRDPPQPAAYFAIQQLTAYMPTLHVRMDGRRNTADVVAAVRHEFDVLDRGVPVFNVKSLQDRVDDSLSRERLVSVLAGAFGVLALLLASVGLYGVMAYLVTRRTREIGIRIALGSSPKGVLWLVAKETVMLLGWGIFAGVSAGMIAARFVSNQLFGLSAADPVTLLGASATMFLATALAIAVPVRRASRIDPTVALRHE